jgi:hypothetical protein
VTDVQVSAPRSGTDGNVGIEANVHNSDLSTSPKQVTDILEAEEQVVFANVNEIFFPETWEAPEMSSNSSSNGGNYNYNNNNYGGNGNSSNMMSITAKGATLKEARANAYKATEWISFENKYKRNDIGKAIDEA